jgi:hypothetical protein
VGSKYLQQCNIVPRMAREEQRRRKKMRRSKVVVVLAACWLGAASNGYCADMMGSVLNTLNEPVRNVNIAVKDRAGVVGSALTNERGNYVIGGLRPDTYTVSLNPLSTRYKSGSTISAVGASGITLNWSVSEINAALASALPGVFSDGIIVSGGLLGGGTLGDAIAISAGVGLSVVGGLAAGGIIAGGGANVGVHGSVSAAQ